MKTIAFFNSTAGVGKTTLVYHLASMIADRGETVLAVDLDPQANLTRMFLAEDELETWSELEFSPAISRALRPMVRGFAYEPSFHIAQISPKLVLFVGDPRLATFEDRWSEAWSNCRDGDRTAFVIMSAFHRQMRQAAEEIDAQWVLIDIGPNLSAINRAALIASEQVVIPLSPDLFSLQGLRNLGPSLKSWREIWQKMLTKNPDALLDLPCGEIKPLGYVVMLHGMRGNRPPKAYLRWIDRIPGAYRTSVLGEPVDAVIDVVDDPHCLAVLKHYRSLMPMAMEARKPVFALKPADGAIGAHNEAVRRAYLDFQELATRIVERSGGTLR